MSDSAAPQDGQPTTENTGSKPWWKRWWGITLIVLAVLLVLASLGGDPEETADETAAPIETSTPAETPTQAETPTAAPAAECVEADAALVAAIEEGLTVDGGGSLENAKAVEVPDELRNDRGWPVYVVGAQISGPGMDGTVGTWATSAEPATIIALNQMAQEFSDWGSAAQPGSDAAAVRDTIASYEETSQVEDCASA